MKNKNIETIIDFEIKNAEYSPVKKAIYEELQAVISQVYQLDSTVAQTLRYLVDIMMEHFHEDIARVPRGDLTPIEHELNRITYQIESARMVLLKAGYEDRVEVGNPVWYLNAALQNFERMKKLASKEK